MFAILVIVAVAAVIGKYFKGHSAAAASTALFVIVPAFVPPYGVALLGTLPLSIVVYPVMLMVYRFADKQKIW
jgi:hypothetical protein